jgi:hypothetical protein
MAVQTNIIPTGNSAPGTAFSGPVVSGDQAPGSNTPNQGLSVNMQQVTLVQNSTNAVSGTLYLPPHSIITDIIFDSTTAWNSATSATGSVGTSAGGTQYASGVNTLAAGGARSRPTFTAAQLAAMLDAGGAVVATITPVGATSAGQTTVTVVYEQTANYQNP